ncbi:carboxymuconolactone decarboxylase family protein [Amycolatopsis aidingensis]|uniref:carboxymuconolactone decarboxylase family protein n=1 Tax=Amycolatopsis aidingensis TaxID=2842453 RepID=UPI001C0D6596|nr:carboxymuconolactone decarboxylase family protein [Amycolatopsis aidingensis]
MPHIELDNDGPGLAGLLRYRPETAGPLAELAHVLLHGPSTLSPGERELIAARVSEGNECQFCATAHHAVAHAALGPDPEISAKLAALLEIADRVRESGTAVTGSQVAAARAAGASDLEIHDTVLIAAAFCMYNRYVDGLGTVMPEDPATDFAIHAQHVLAHGYRGPGRQDRDTD